MATGRQTLFDVVLSGTLDNSTKFELGVAEKVEYGADQNILEAHESVDYQTAELIAGKVTASGTITRAKLYDNAEVRNYLLSSGTNKAKKFTIIGKLRGTDNVIVALRDCMITRVSGNLEFDDYNKEVLPFKATKVDYI